MTIYNSDIWIEDLDRVINSFPWFKELQGTRILVTGSTGLICSAVIDLLIRINEKYDGNIKVLAAGRNQNKIDERFGEYSKKDYFEYIPYDSTEEVITRAIDCDYIIHGASNAYPEAIVKEPVETMLSNFTGMNALLKLARDIQVKRVLYISSSEVYGRKEDDRPYKETDYGFIDLLNPRNSYSVGKRAAETLCASYMDEYGISSVIVRPGHIYGPTASRNDNRVSSAWAFDVASGNDIIMKSDGKQLRSYCYCLDLASAILTVLVRGENLSAYNVSNPDSVISIKEMAELLACISGVSLIMADATETERKGFNPMNNSSLDSTALLNLGWKGLFDAKEGFTHTVQIIKNMYSE